MLSKLSRRLRPRSIYDVCAALALFVALGGTAYAVNTVNSTDIVDGQVKSVDVANQDLTGGDIKDNSISSFDVASLVGDDVVDNTLTGADIKNGSVTTPDITKGGLPAIVGVTIGTVAARSCKYFSLNAFDGLTDELDTIVVTPLFTSTATNLIYTAEAGIRFPHIKICNPTDAAINDGGTTFSLVAING